jgi:hypothetical protein
MLFASYWELSENVAVQDQFTAAQKIMASELFPPQGVNIVHWGITPDRWGILILEAENAAQVDRAFYVWRAALPGIFKSSKSGPMLSIQDHLAIAGEVIESLK